MKYLKKAALLVEVSLVISITSCNRERCYQCYNYVGYFLAIKNSDTLEFGIYLSRAQTQDSMNLYSSLGYRIDTFSNSIHPDPTNGAPICVGPGNDWPTTQIPDSCVLIK